MLNRLPWPLLVLMGGLLNVGVNYGYKVTAADAGIVWVIVAALSITAITLALYATFTHRQKWSALVQGRTPWIVLALGVNTALVAVCFLSALVKGPISLVDPLWACIYALMSVTLGTILIRERPSKTALLGIGLYLAGAVLMGLGA